MWTTTGEAGGELAFEEGPSDSLQFRLFDNVTRSVVAKSCFAALSSVVNLARCSC